MLKVKVMRVVRAYKYPFAILIITAQENQARCFMAGLFLDVFYQRNDTKCSAASSSYSHRHRYDKSTITLQPAASASASSVGKELIVILLNM